MTNMTNNQVFRGALTALAGILLCTVSSSLLAAQEANAAVYAAMKGNPKLRLVQTNFAGDAVSIIDPATNKVVGEIPGIEMAHGISVAKTTAKSTSLKNPRRRSSLSTGRRYRSPNEFL
jgi:hypothetical protein